MSDAGVFIAGAGLVSAAGEASGADATAFARTLASRAFGPVEIAAFPGSPGTPPVPRPSGPAGTPSRGFPCAGFDLGKHSRTIQSYIDRVSALAVGASALARAGEPAPGPEAGEIGLFFGTAWGALASMAFFDAAARKSARAAPPLVFSHSYANSPASLVAIEGGLRGASCVYSSGGVSGAQAIGLAADLAARRGALASRERILAGGAEALSASRWRHEALEGSLAAGRLPGEGAAFLLLSARPEGGALARLAGSDFAAGGGLASAIARAAAGALARASLRPEAVDLVVSGAGLVPEERAAEAEALAEVFGGRLPALVRPALAFGETAGAAGALSAALAALALGGKIPPEALAALVEDGGALAGPPRAALVLALEPGGASAGGVLPGDPHAAALALRPAREDA